MYKYTIIKDPGYKDDYIYQGRNEKNQILFFEICGYMDRCFYVEFYITTKRKDGFQTRKQTGKDGVKSLLWAKNCIVKFIEEFGEKYQGYTIRVYANDTRRLNTYERGLKDIGFRKSYSKPFYMFYKL